jgi:cytoskeletal protein CcmA (bactofilin family)
MKKDKVPVTCPHCGHKQLEPAQAYSTVCKQCREHYRVQEALHPVARPKEAAIEVRRIHCFSCSGELDVAAAAQSTICKRCGSHVDLKDYRIAQAAARNYRTKGRLVIEKEGFLFNTDTVAGEVILKGRFMGKLTAERSLEIHRGAEIKGSFTAELLIIPAETVFHWPGTLALGGAEVAGEVVANLLARGSVVLKSTVRYFGQIQAAHLVVESGAVFVGKAEVGVKQ